MKKRVNNKEIIKKLLRQREMTILGVARELKVSYETAARHLRMMYNLGEVSRKNYGKPHVLHYNGRYRQMKLQ
jgi:predicted transcriptional regulator